MTNNAASAVKRPCLFDAAGIVRFGTCNCAACEANRTDPPAPKRAASLSAAAAMALALVGCGWAPGYGLYDDRDAGAGAGPGRRVASIHDCSALLDSGPAFAAFLDEAAPLAGVSLAFARDVAYWWEVRCVDDHTQDVHCADAWRQGEGDPLECTQRPKPGVPSDTYLSTDIPAGEMEAYALHGLLHAILMAHDGDESHRSPAWDLLNARTED